jgi:hypothetical protein
VLNYDRAELAHRLQKCRQRHAETTRDLRHGFNGRIPQACFDSCDVGAIKFGALREILLSPLALLSTLPDSCAHIAQERILPFGHASGCCDGLALSIDYQ